MHLKSKLKIILFIQLFLFLFSSKIISQKNLRIGYINMEYILENLEEYNLANQEYSLKLEKWRKEIEERLKKIEQEYEELEIKRPLITSTIYNEFKKEIDFKKFQLENYQQKRFGAEGDWITQEKILIQPIQDEVLEEDKEMIEDLVISAVNKGINMAQAKSKEKMDSVTGGMLSGLNIPGI